MSQIISSLLNKASNYIKEKFTKTEFNIKLTDLKIIKLIDIIEKERSKLNPFVKGLLLDESKGSFEQIDLNSDSNYNKLETAKEKIKPLESISNYPINFTSWFDYLKKAIFGNRNLESNNILKYLKKNKNNSNYNQNNNFSFNCDGKLIGFINQDGDLIISKTESDYVSYSIKSSTEGITSFSWDKINPNKIFYSTSTFLYEGIIKLSASQLYISKEIPLSNVSKFINCFPSPKGELLILLYEKKIEVYDMYDMFQNLLFSKYFTTFKFKNALFDYKSSVFITYTDNQLVIFNIDTFDFKPYSYFPGTIIKVINNQDNDNIYVFVADNSKESGELFMFTLTDISIASDVTLNFNSYQNSDNFYRQYHYVLRPEIYSFQHQLMLLHTKILDVDLSPNDFRLGILYEEEVNNRSLYIFALTKDKRDDIINEGYPLYNFGHIDGTQIVSFEFNKMLNKNTFLVVRFEKDIFIKTEKING